MTLKNRPRLLIPLLYLCMLIVCGCAAHQVAAPPPEVTVVLLPKDGKPSGEVVVSNAQGSQVLKESYQSVEVAGADAKPAAPVKAEGAVVQEAFAPALSALPVPPAHFTVFFKLDSTELTPDSRQLLPEIVEAIEKRRPAQLVVVGHTDTLASESYNYRLGLHRAQTVSAQLQALGANPGDIELSSRGKSELLVKTPDHTPEQRNRRAEITVR
ncbi:OmpA family protein [Geomonas sp.]|uniref:OmpA family protein n=1 Tax=Geomonas sp. TaxID=2651584 RepID=UPI002B4A6ED6|nr:OmpA family protein [Geomonas sp.]HJV36190.1 OmpA family protein [Geomonas sp.]